MTKRLKISENEYNYLLTQARENDAIADIDNRIVGRRVTIIVTLVDGTKLIETIVGRAKRWSHFTER